MFNYLASACWLINCALAQLLPLVIITVLLLDLATSMCWKCLRLTFSSDLEEAMFETG